MFQGLLSENRAGLIPALQFSQMLEVGHCVPYGRPAGGAGRPGTSGSAAASLQEQANQTVPSSYLDEFCFFL